MLEANNVDAAAKLFAATTLKGKVHELHATSYVSNPTRSSTTSTSYPASRYRIFASPL